MEEKLSENEVRSGIPIPEFNSEKQDSIIASMKKMKINDYIDVDKTIKNQYYEFAKKAGIKITVRLLENGVDYGCWRIKDED